MHVVDLLHAIEVIIADHPNAELEKNAVGNLAIIVDGKYTGFIDLRDGEIEYNEPPQSTDEAAR